MIPHLGFKWIGPDVQRRTHSPLLLVGMGWMQATKAYNTLVSFRVLQGCPSCTSVLSTLRPCPCAISCVHYVLVGEAIQDSHEYS